MTDAHDVEAARSRALRLLSARSRSCHELAGRLTRAGFDEGVVDEVLERLQRVGLLDDHSFAVQVVESAVRSGKSANRIRHDLLRRGIDSMLAEDVLEGVGDREAEAERALALARKRVASCGNLAATKAVPRVVRHLCAQGFDADLAWETGRLAWEEHGG